MSLQSRLLVTALTLGSVVGLASVAHATPYAFASNQITGLTVTLAGGAPLPVVGTPTTSISDSAQWAGSSNSGFQNSGVVGNALTISQAFSGPGAAPPATYTPQGPTFIGARADAAIGAGSASTGGVSVMNVAEANGNALGNSVGTNNAAISFTIVGTGQALALSFSDLIQLAASTAALPGETANAAIQNNFSITAQGASTPLATFSPADINRQIASNGGNPLNNTVGPSTFSESFTSPTLLNGVTYNVALTSTASETVLPGRANTPEPASLAIMGAGLVALSLVRRRRPL